MMAIRFQIGDPVFVATFEAHETWIECPDCAGTGRIRCMLPDDTMVSIECECCRRGYEGPFGRLLVYERKPFVCETVISGIEMREDGIEWRTRCSYLVKDANIFASRDDAMRRAEEIAAEQDRAERERIATKEKNTKSWAWNVHYHRREIREAEKRIAYHKAKLAVASLKAKEPAT